MKIAISVPDDVLSRAEDVTRKLNEVYAKEDSSLDPVLDLLQSLSLRKKEYPDPARGQRARNGKARNCAKVHARRSAKP